MADEKVNGADKSVEAKPEVKPDPVEEIRAELEKERQERQKLGRMLTQTQQDYAESTKFLKTVLPKLNKLEEKHSEKTFVDEWEESPEQAIEARAEKKVQPLAETTRRMQHELALIKLRQKYPDFMDLETKIAELSNEDDLSASWSWTEKGLEKLYKIAKAEKNEVESKTKERDTEKTRAFTESSEGSAPAPAEAPKPLSASERRMMKALGLDEKTFNKWRHYREEQRDDA